MKDRRSSVLLVEDDETHAVLIKRSFEGLGVESITWISDGDEALDMLFHRGKYTDDKSYLRPDLVLLDLRLPKHGGLEVLKEIKTSEDLKSIPVVILTTSKNKQDIENAYKNHANSYLVKPLGFYEFQQMTKDIVNYWLEWNQNIRVD